MRFFFIFNFGIMCFLHLAQAYSVKDSVRNLDDSVKTYISKPVITIGKSLPGLGVDGVNYSKTSLSADFLKNIPSKKMEHIAMLLPGMEFRDYGGTGALALISSRGLGPQRLSVLIDGIPLSSPQNGMFDAGSLPVLSNQDIVFHSGGASAFVGSGAMGGYLELSTPYGADSLQVKSQVGLGSYGEKTVKTSLTTGNRLESYQCSVDYTDFQGDYPIEYQSPGLSSIQTATRVNGGTSSLFFFGRAGFSSENQQNTIAFWSALKSVSRGVPGAVLSGRIEDSKAHFGDNELLSSCVFTKQFSESQLLKGGLSYRYGRMHFKDSSALYAGKNGVDNDFITNDVFCDVQSQTIVLEHLIATLKLNGGYTVVQGDMLQQEAGNSPSRLFGALSARMEYQVDAMHYDFGTRADFFNDASGNALSAYLSNTWNFFGGFFLK